LTGLLRDALGGFLILASVVVALEASAAGLGRLFQWGMLFKPIVDTAYDGFVGAAVGAEAVLLALFFTTVGVVASTAYADVPGEIRSLFVRERSSLLYVSNVAGALIVGLTLLVLPELSAYRFHGVSILFFGVLSVLSVLSLAVISIKMFSFFDLSTLFYPLPRQFLLAIKSASAAGAHVPQEIEQRAAHDRAAAVLQRYRELTDIICGRRVSEAKAPESLAQQLMLCWDAASDVKPSIPTKSRWYSFTPQHPNWLTLSHPQLSMAMVTKTSVQPSLAPRDSSKSV